MRRNTWQGRNSFANLIVSRPTVVFRWRTKDHSKCLHSTLPAKLLHTEDSPNVSVDHYRSFSSFMREYLDKVIKADQCVQYVDHIGIAANDAGHLLKNLRATFECIRKSRIETNNAKMPI